MFIVLVCFALVVLVALALRSEDRPSWLRNRAFPFIEALESRECPAGTWIWSGPAPLGALWSNPAGVNWLHNGGLAAAGQYPGMAGSNNDAVLFNNAPAGDATLDVGIGTLGALQFTGWNNILWVQAGRTLEVSGGSFALADGTFIDLGANCSLRLVDASQSAWTSGSIKGGAMANVLVAGTTLNLTGTPGNLEVNLSIVRSGATGAAGQMTLGLNVPMTDNLMLTGLNNSITVDNGGTLSLFQTIMAAGDQDTEGGIEFGGAHGAGTVAVTVNAGGTLTRTGPPSNPGIINQVLISGPVYNNGGVVQVQGTNNRLHISGTDAANRSYWQKNAASAQLFVFGGNINATGTYQIDTGAVKLTAVAGAVTDELDGAGLLFGNANPTFLTIVDSTVGAPGTVTIQGPVTLAANTTTTMNFRGGGVTADLIDVRNGTLTLNGTLKLISGNGIKPLLPLNFFDDQGGVPTIAGNFTAITVLDILMAQIANAKVTIGGVVYYQVTIT